MSKAMTGGMLAALFFVITSLTSSAQAQQPDGIAEYVNIANSSVRDGQVVVVTSEGYKLSSEEYSRNIYGVTTIDPAVAWSRVPKAGATAVVNSGTTVVLVNNSGGPIDVGDWVTSSAEEGIGMRASQPGLAVGRALSSLPEGTTTGAVTITVDPQFASPESVEELPLTPGAALATLRSGFIVATGGAANFSIRYALAVLAFLISLGFSLWIFSRTATNAVRAVGRNPLARRSILFVAALNVVMAVAIVVAGLILGLLILAL